MPSLLEDLAMAVVVVRDGWLTSCDELDIRKALDGRREPSVPRRKRGLCELAFSD